MRQSNAIIFTKSCARMLVTLCCKQELHQPSSLEFKTTKLLKITHKGGNQAKLQCWKQPPPFSNQRKRMSLERNRSDTSEFMGKTFQAAQLTHERFLTPAKYFFDICQTELPLTSGV